MKEVKRERLAHRGWRYTVVVEASGRWSLEGQYCQNSGKPGWQPHCRQAHWCARVVRLRSSYHTRTMFH